MAGFLNKNINMKSNTENICSTCKHKTDNEDISICKITQIETNRTIVDCNCYDKKSKLMWLKGVAFVLAYWISMSVIMALLDNNFDLKHTTIWNLGVVMGIVSYFLNDILFKD